VAARDEHEDDLEPEVIEGAEIETEKYQEMEEEDVTPEREVTNSPGYAEERNSPADAEPAGEAGDTI